MGESATSGRKVAATFSRQKALKLRIAGKSYAEIAEALGCSRTFAHKLVTTSLDALKQKQHESAEQLRQIDLARIDAAIAAIWERVSRAPDGVPDDLDETTEGLALNIKPNFEAQDRAITNLVKLLDRRAKLMGLDTPTTQRLEHTGAGGQPLGLPPQLAMLTPPPTVDEVEHFCAVVAGACSLVTCRPHGKAAL